MPELVDANRVAAISALLTEFCWCADNAQGDRIASLFSEKGSIKTPHFEVNGIDEIRTAFGARPPKLSRHNWMNLRITPLGPDRYTVETNMITATGPLPAPQAGGNIAITTSTDEIVFENGAALFASRTLAIAFEGTIVAKEPVA